MQHTLIINDVEYRLTLARAEQGYRLRVNGGEGSQVRLAANPAGGHRLTFDETVHDLVAIVEGDRVHIHLDGSTYEVAYIDPVQKHAALGGASTQDQALAPMPGTVVAVHVATGDVVAIGQPLMVIESMKLETTIKAWRAGTVAAVHVAKGEQFERQAGLVTLVALAAGGA